MNSSINANKIDPAMKKIICCNQAQAVLDAYGEAYDVGLLSVEQQEKINSLLDLMVISVKEVMSR